MCLLHSYRIVMGVGQTEADRGCQIKEELLLDFCSLEVKPGARMKSRMTSAEVKKPKMWLTFESMLKVQLIVSKVSEY